MTTQDKATARAIAAKARAAEAEALVPSKDAWPVDANGDKPSAVLGLMFPVAPDGNGPPISVLYFWPLRLADMRAGDGLGKMEETAHFLRRSCHLTETVADRIRECDVMRANEVLQDFFAGSL